MHNYAGFSSNKMDRWRSQSDWIKLEKKTGWSRLEKLHRTPRKLFEILLSQTEMGLYLLFPDWFGTKRTSVWIKINRKMVNTIWFRFDLIRLQKDISVCTLPIREAYGDNRSLIEESLKPLNTTVLWCMKGSRRTLNFGLLIETLVSQTAVHLIAIVFFLLVYIHQNFYIFNLLLLFTFNLI